MKQFFLFLLTCLGVNVFATVRTVSNNPTTIAQFSTIQAAVDVSVNGDTIYVQGSPTPYSGFTIQDKRLTIIGPGWYPLQSFQPFKAIIGTNVNINGVASRKTELQGLDFFPVFQFSRLLPTVSVLFAINSRGLFIWALQPCLIMVGSLKVIGLTQVGCPLAPRLWLQIFCFRIIFFMLYQQLETYWGF